MVKYYNLLLVLAVLFTANIVFSQKNITTKLQSRYHVIDLSELDNINRNLRDFISTPPPTGQVRSIAEFEKMQGVIVAYTWGFGIPVSAIAEMSEDIIIYTVVQNQVALDDVTIIYNNNGVNMANVEFVEAPLNSYWSRDYSPWFIREENKISIVDFPYNRPRPKDDNIPVVFSNYLSTELYGMALTHTGGNYMTDGMGIGASTDIVADENSSMTIIEIDDMVDDYLGLDDYVLCEDPLDEYIKHIDCWGKFLDIDKILIGSVPTADSRYADYEAMADFWANKQSSYGTTFKVFRTYSSSGQPYTNSLILNNKVFVPIVTGTGSQWNDSALAVYQTAMPGYEIFGIEEGGSVNWQSTDALHCRTHGVPDLGMLYIKHIPLTGEMQYQAAGYQIEADITAYNNTALIPDSLKIYYKIGSGMYQTVDLVLQSGITYNSNIIADYGDTVYYYIHAADLSGRSANHPFVGSSEPHLFIIEADTTQTIISENEIINSFKVFPNPSNGVIYIKSNYDLIEIYSIDGSKIYTTSINGIEYYRIDLSKLRKGIYVVKGYKQNSVVTEKLILY